MSKRRRSLTPNERDRLLVYYEGTCQYCGDEATELDHIVPYESSGPTIFDNLTASCSRCNSIAGARVFKSFEDKKSYVLRRIEEKRHAKVKTRRQAAPKRMVRVAQRSQGPITLCYKCSQIVDKDKTPVPFLCGPCHTKYVNGIGTKEHVTISVATTRTGETYAIRDDGEYRPEIMGPLNPYQERRLRSHPYAWVGAQHNKMTLDVVTEEIIAAIE